MQTNTSTVSRKLTMLSRAEHKLDRLIRTLTLPEPEPQLVPARIRNHFAARRSHFHGGAR